MPRVAQPARTHLTLRDAAIRLAHSTRWVRDRIKANELEAFKHSRNDITVSLQSIVAYEARVRVSSGV